MTKTFLDVKKEYLNTNDGQLRDFIIFDVSPSDWDKIISIVSATADHFKFENDGVETPPPSELSEIANWEQERGGILFMRVSGMLITCILYGYHEYDLIFSVYDARKGKKWKKLLAFFQKIVDYIGKKGIITYEWNDDRPEIRPDLVIEEILPSTHGLGGSLF
jgi:hypothetical protein